ncbi:hypothetical protein VV869_04225 [Photobacterium sp. MCCC 1A19761]|uniref:hypothetical protein n=1 Tax=Photobacterium sp. MCCC 1A19761 TaxID=3115000 RepID=UPI00307D51D0
MSTKENVKYKGNYILILLCLLSFKAMSEPKSLFVQVSSVYVGTESWKTKAWFEKVCSEHKNIGSNDYIYNLVLQQTGDHEGNLYNAQLDIIDDYFYCFDNIFMGTTTESGADDYVKGITSEKYRWNHIKLSNTIADKILAKYPGLWFNWYISHEANLNHFISGRTGYSNISGYEVKEAYLAYIKQLSEDLNKKTERAILWSPTFWNSFDELSCEEKDMLKMHLSDFFSKADKITWLHFQDFIGQASLASCQGVFQCEAPSRVIYPIDYKNTVSYYNLLKEATMNTNVQSLRVNMEMFVTSSEVRNEFFPGQFNEIREREKRYKENGIPIGASWEIRWWYRSLYGNE